MPPPKTTYSLAIESMSADWQQENLINRQWLLIIFIITTKETSFPIHSVQNIRRTVLN